MDFREWLGGEDVIRKYCHALALEGGKKLAQMLNTELLDPTEEFTANMVRRLS